MRTFDNGFVIEELAQGPPSGKLAKPGKKVQFQPNYQNVQFCAWCDTTCSVHPTTS